MSETTTPPAQKAVRNVGGITVHGTSFIDCSSGSRFPVTGSYFAKVHVVDQFTCANLTSFVVGTDQDEPPRPCLPEITQVYGINRDTLALVFNETLHFAISAKQCKSTPGGVVIVIEILSIDPASKHGHNLVAFAFYALPEGVDPFKKHESGAPRIELQLYRPRKSLALGQVIQRGDKSLDPTAGRLAGFIQGRRKSIGVSLTISLTRKPAPPQTTVTDRRPQTIFETEAPSQTYEELLASCTKSNLLTFRATTGIAGGTSFNQLTKGSVINLTAPPSAPTHRDPLLPCKLPTQFNPSPQLSVGIGCTCAVFSPYGRYLAVASQEASTSSNTSAAGRHVIRLHPLDTEAKSGSKLDLSKSIVDQVVELVGHNEPVRDMVWSPDSTELYAISSDGTVMSWNFVHESPIRSVASHSSPFTSLALRPTVDESSEEGEYSQTRTLLIGCSDGQLRRYQISGNPMHRTIRSIERVTLHRAPILAITWDPEGRRIVTGDSSGTAAAWTFTSNVANKANSSPLSPFGRSPASAAAAVSPGGLANRMFSSFSIASDSSGQGGGLAASGSMSKSPSTFAPNAESIGQPRLDCIKIIPNVMDGPIKAIHFLPRSKRVAVVGQRSVALYDYLYRQIQLIEFPMGAKLSCRPVVTICTSHLLVGLDSGDVWVLTILGPRSSLRMSVLDLQRLLQAQPISKSVKVGVGKANGQLKSVALAAPTGTLARPPIAALAAHPFMDVLAVANTAKIEFASNMEGKGGGNRVSAK